MNVLGARTTAWLALVVALAPSMARAQAEPTFSYHSDAPGCPDADRVRARLLAALRAAPAGELPPIASTLAIAPDGAALVATVTLREGEYEDRRELRGDDCALLTDAALLVVAVALSPGIESLPPDETPLPPPPVEEVAAAPPREDVRGLLWLAARAAYGVLPGLAVGGELGGSLAVGALRIDAGVRGLPFVASRLGITPGLGSDLAQLAGLVRARGAGAVVEQLELSAGGGIEAGAVLGHGVGISDPRDAAAPWVAFEAVAGLSWVPWPIVAFFFEIEALVPIVRPVFTVSGLGVVYRPEPVAGALRLGVEVRLP